MTARQDYVAELNRISGRFSRLEDETIKRVLTLLKTLRGEIAAELSAQSSWAAYRAGRVEASVNRLIDEFMAQAGAEARASFEQAVRSGELSVVEPLSALGVDVGFYRPSQAQVNVAVDFSARLIQDIGDETRRAVDQQLRLASLGGAQPVDAMRGITQALGLDAQTGIWKKRADPVRGVAARAETVLRTEMGRMYNLAAFSQVEAGRVPGMTKSWLATVDGRTRVEHLRAHARYQSRPIPVEDFFEVDGERLRFPGDPSAGARATVNCRCRTQYHHPAVGRVGSPLDGRVAAELERRNG